MHYTLQSEQGHTWQMTIIRIEDIYREREKDHLRYRRSVYGLGLQRQFSVSNIFWDTFTVKRLSLKV